MFLLYGVDVMSRHRRRQEKKFREALFRAAMVASATSKERRLDYGFHDGTLVHAVLHDERTLLLDKLAPGRNRAMMIGYSKRQVWVTACGLALAVDEPLFSRTKKSTTCFACLSWNPNKTVSLVFPWDGSIPVVA